MKLLRQTIRKILAEQMSEFKKWHKPKEAEVAVDEIGDMFKLKHGELLFEPEPNCTVRLRVQAKFGSIFLDEIETTPDCEGKGYATAVINMIKSVSKKHMVKITLKAKAFHTQKGEGRMSTEQLEDWYRSQGFVKNGWKMEWKPQ